MFGIPIEQLPVYAAIAISELPPLATVVILKPPLEGTGILYHRSSQTLDVFQIDEFEEPVLEKKFGSGTPVVCVKVLVILLDIVVPFAGTTCALQGSSPNCAEGILKTWSRAPQDTPKVGLRNLNLFILLVSLYVALVHVVPPSFVSIKFGSVFPDPPIQQRLSFAQPIP